MCNRIGCDCRFGTYLWYLIKLGHEWKRNIAILSTIAIYFYIVDEKMDIAQPTCNEFFMMAGYLKIRHIIEIELKKYYRD